MNVIRQNNHRLADHWVVRDNGPINRAEQVDLIHKRAGPAIGKGNSKEIRSTRNKKTSIPRHAGIVPHIG